MFVFVSDIKENVVCTPVILKGLGREMEVVKGKKKVYGYAKRINARVRGKMFITTKNTPFGPVPSSSFLNQSTPLYPAAFYDHGIIRCH